MTNSNKMVLALVAKVEELGCKYLDENDPDLKALQEVKELYERVDKL